MSADCSEKCKNATERTKKAQAEWDAKWPNACRKCESRGVITWYESRDWWGATASELMGEPCECTAVVTQAIRLSASLTVETVRGCCPRCRAPQEVDENEFVDKAVACVACGWAWGKNKDDARPEIHECDCWELAMEEKIREAREFEEVDYDREMD